MATPLTPRDDEEEEVVLALKQLSQSPPKQPSDEEIASILEHTRRWYLQSRSRKVRVALKVDRKPRKKRKVQEFDNSKETLEILGRWNKVKHETPPFLRADAMKVCSQPIRKQVTESDVKGNQYRLMLGKAQVQKMMDHVIMKKEELEKINGKYDKGLEVSVYTDEEKSHKMMFKMWNGSTPVLKSSGWNKFVKENELKMHSSFLTIWMFRHRETLRICFAIDCVEFKEIEKPLGSTILKNVFNSN